MRKYYSLVDKIYCLENLHRAYRHVRSNNGAPGIDGETVAEFGLQLEERLEEIHLELKTGTYRPSPVRRTEINKDDGGKRPLGIPTVRDRVVQQAVRQIVEPIFEVDFHPSSYAYRPGRSCHMAVAKAEQFMNRYELPHVVDMDLSNKGWAAESATSKVLGLIRRFLEAGGMEDGAWEATELGSPQGDVISPLLSSIYLDEFDQRMKALDIRIVRYADDILIFAKSARQAERYQEIAEKILEEDLKLTVNRDKTHRTSLNKGVRFLGFIIYPRCVAVHPKRIKRFKDRVRELTPRNHGRNLKQQIVALNRFLRGWINYFCIANCKGHLSELMGWIRRRLRMKKMCEWKTWKGLHRALRQRGYTGEYKKISMKRWRNAASPLINMALPNSWFEKMGLVDLTKYEVGVLHRYVT